MNVTKNLYNRTKINNFGEKLSDKIASIIGSWTFIIIQSLIIIAWISFNLLVPDAGWMLFGLTFKAFDPFPFIFLNLTMSFEAAYSAPIIMMSQNRQTELDRESARLDYAIDVDAKNDIEQVKEDLNSLNAGLLRSEERQIEMMEMLKKNKN